MVDMVSSILLLLDWREAKEEALVKGMVRVVLVELWSLEEMILEKSDDVPDASEPAFWNSRRTAAIVFCIVLFCDSNII